MSTAAVMRLRTRHRFGPALRGTDLPVASIALSAALHAGLIATILFAAEILPSSESKTYVVNLVPAVAAIGRPEAPRTPNPSPTPPRPPEPSPPAQRPAPAPDLPARAPELPARTAELPARAPELPTRTAELPARNLPPRALPPPESLPPRPSEKELPRIAGATTKAPPPSIPTPFGRREMPPPQAGRPDGSAQGSGPVTVDVDFPYAWYIQAVHRKISQNWDGEAREGTQPIIMFEIARNGEVGRVLVEKTSGNPLYDQAAVRAIHNSTPFPQLPADFKAPLIRVHLSFGFTPRQG